MYCRLNLSWPSWKCVTRNVGDSTIVQSPRASSYCKWHCTCSLMCSNILFFSVGDSCCNPLSMGSIKSMLEKKISGVYVRSLMIGDSILQVFGLVLLWTWILYCLTLPLLRLRCKFSEPFI